MCTGNILESTFLIPGKSSGFQICWHKVVSYIQVVLKWNVNADWMTKFWHSLLPSEVLIFTLNHRDVYLIHEDKLKKNPSTFTAESVYFRYICVCWLQASSFLKYISGAFRRWCIIPECELSLSPSAHSVLHLFSSPLLWFWYFTPYYLHFVIYMVFFDIFHYLSWESEERTFPFGQTT